MRYSLFAALLIGLPLQGAVAEPRADVEIVLANFSFTPTTLRLKAGQPVTLHFVNRGSGGHNFAAPEFFAGVASVRGGKVELAKGERRDVTLTPRAGTYQVRCTHFLHSGFGMKGTIIVA
jgi:plastocyanin